MPSIEIVCEGQKEPADFKDMPFAVIAETKLESHRIPSRFQNKFDTLQGCIYHLGNPDLKEDDTKGAFFAYELLSDKSRHSENGILLFTAGFKKSVREMMETLIEHSPTGQIIFTSDWQFGPEDTTDGGRLTITQFWRKHDAEELKINGLYVLAKK